MGSNRALWASAAITPKGEKLNILLLNGSPRKGGNTDIVLSLLTKALRHDGHQVDRHELAQLHIKGCIGCGHCDTQSTCIFDDDMTGLYEQIIQADCIVIGSPIYFYTVTAQTKAFIDRCQVLWCRKYLRNEIQTSQRNRKGYFVSIAATKGEKLFTGAQLTLKYAFDAMDVCYAGDLLIKGVDAKGAIKNHPAQLEKITQLAAHIGQE